MSNEAPNHGPARSLPPTEPPLVEDLNLVGCAVETDAEPWVRIVVELPLSRHKKLMRIERAMEMERRGHDMKAILKKPSDVARIMLGRSIDAAHNSLLARKRRAKDSVSAETEGTPK